MSQSHLAAYFSVLHFSVPPLPVSAASPTAVSMNKTCVKQIPTDPHPWQIPVCITVWLRCRERVYFFASAVEIGGHNNFPSAIAWYDQFPMCCLACTSW